VAKTGQPPRGVAAQRDRAVATPAARDELPAEHRQWMLWRPPRRPALLLLSVLLLAAWIGFLIWMAVSG
jgi:hypothetical protein